MLSYTRVTRTACSLLILAFVAPLGCATGPPAGGSRGAAAVPDLDPARAWLPLERIEPSPSRPAAAEAIKPLSDRARRQIDRAQALIAEDRFTEAAIELERALRYDPQHPEIHRALARLHWEAGNAIRARTHANRALDTAPDDASVHYILGRVHRSSDDPAAALLSFRTAILCSNIDDDAEVAALCHYHLALTLADEGYLEAALSQYDAFHERSSALPDETTVGGELGVLCQNDGRAIAVARVDLLEKLGRFGAAAEVLAPHLGGAADDEALGVRHARLLFKADRLEEALVAARRLPLTRDDVVQVLFDVHERGGHPERIVDDLRVGLAKQPDEPTLVLTIARMLTEAQRLEDAAVALRGFLDDHPGDHSVRAALVRTLLSQKAWMNALALCAEGVERDPSRATAYEALVRTLSVDEAAVELLVSPKTDGISPTSAYLRGVVADAADRPSDAERWLRHGYDTGPGFLPARIALANVLFHAYEYDAALVVATRREEDAPEDARLELVLGQIHERLDDHRTAEQHFQAAIQLDRADTRAMFALATLYQRSRKRLQAQRQYQVLLKQDPDHEAARERLIAIYLEDKPDVAMEQLEELQRRARSPFVRARCAAFLQQVNKHDVEAYRHLLLETMEEHGPDAQTWLAVAQSFDLADETDARQQAFRRVLSIDPDNEEAAVGLVEESRRHLAFEDAAVRLRELLKRRPNHHAWRLGLIDLYWIVQDFDQALAVAYEAEGGDGLDPDIRSRYRMAIVETLRLADRTTESLGKLEAWVAADPDDEPLALFLASEYLRQEQPLKALPIVIATHGATQNTQTLMNVIRALLAAKHFDRASQYLLEWLDRDPENDAALNQLANILTDSDRIDDALELVRNRLSRTLDRERFQTLMVAILSEAERFDDGLELVEAQAEEVIALLSSGGQPRFAQPDSAPTNEQLLRLPNEPFTGQSLYERLIELRDFKIRLLFSTKDYRSAKAELVAWLEMAQDAEERARYLTQLAFCHQALGDDEQAAGALERTLVLHPDDPAINNDVAYGWINQGIKLDQAEPMIRRAVSLQPRNSAYLDTYGWLLYKTGEFAEAKKWLVRANYIRQGDDPVVLDHLGDVLWRLGETKEAVARWEEAKKAGQDRADDALTSADEKRVTDTIDGKIEDGQRGRTPAIAAIADGA